MWQVKAGSYFAFLKRCSELNIPLVQGVRAVLRFRLTFHSWVVPHCAQKENARLPEDSVGWCSQEGPEALGILHFPLLFSCTRHRRKIKSFPQLSSDFLLLPLLLPPPPQHPTILCHLSHIRHHRERLLMPKAKLSLGMDQPCPPWWFINISRSLECMFPLKRCCNSGQ